MKLQHSRISTRPWTSCRISCVPALVCEQKSLVQLISLSLLIAPLLSNSSPNTREHPASVLTQSKEKTAAYEAISTIRTWKIHLYHPFLQSLSSSQPVLSVAETKMTELSLLSHMVHVKEYPNIPFCVWQWLRVTHLVRVRDTQKCLHVAIFHLFFPSVSPFPSSVHLGPCRNR